MRLSAFGLLRRAIGIPPNRRARSRPRAAMRHPSSTAWRAANAGTHARSRQPDPHRGQL